MTNTSAAPIILIDQSGERPARLARVIGSLGHGVREVRALPPAAEEAARARLVMLVTRDDRGLADVRRAFPGARLMVCGLEREQTAAVRAFRAGADDFVWLGGGDQEIIDRIGHHLGAPRPAPVADSCGLVGESPEICRTTAFIRRVAASDATVLIGGETGTGKECATLMLHRLSARAAGPLVALNCAAIPGELMESELFGFERGAFSGANRTYPGKMKLADGGTLMLDEIGELSPAGQAKLLRAVETGEAYRLGGTSPVRFDVRLVASTNRDLAAEVSAGRFREDLYYRLAVAEVRMPPLRERRGDVGPLARHLLAAVVRSRATLSAAAEAALARHHWPGNARELRNVLEIAALSADEGEIGCEHLPPALQSAAPAATEHDELMEVLRRAGGNKAAAARALNCSRMTLYRRLARSGIDRSEPQPTCPGGSGPASDRGVTL